MSDEREIFTMSVNDDGEVKVQFLTTAEFAAKMALKYWGDGVTILNDVPTQPDPMYWPTPCLLVMKAKRVKVEIGTVPSPSTE